MSAALPNITTWQTPLSKGAMEAADVLYGITMEESGVSRLLSVQLEGQDKDTRTA
nr:hypothetical protein [Desulfitobacterium hafniense]